MAFFNFRKNQQGTYLATFSVSIDFNDRYQKEQRHPGYEDFEVLSPSSGPYRFHQRYSNDERNSNDEKYVIATYDELKKFAVNVLNHELQDECEQLLGIPIIRIKVIRAYEGSIQLFFTVLFVVDILIRLKDIYDGVCLLRKIAEKKLEQRYKQQYGDYFRIDVSREIPRDSDDFRKNYIHDEMMRMSPQLPLTGTNLTCDGLFYYLLISNVVLLSFVIALAFSAVVKVYFH